MPTIPTTQITRPEEVARAAVIQLSRAVEEERRRIAVGLHDDVGQTLAAANMRLHELRSATTGRAREEAADQVERLLREAISTIRGLTFDLRPPVIPGEGFPAVLDRLAERFRDDHGHGCAVDSDPPRFRIDNHAAEVIFLVVRELLHNVAKHAGASTVVIRVRVRDDGLEVAVLDDGRGFDTTSPRNGFGLLMAAERATEVGGTLELRSGRNGTSAILLIPDAVEGNAP